MKKLFLLIPALILSMMMNAKVIEIGSGTSNILYSTIAASSTDNGDVIVLTDAGPYVNAYGNDYTKLRKNLTIKAAPSVKPVIKFQVPFRLSDAASVKFIGLKFDGSDLEPNVGYNYYFRVNSNEDNCLEFEDCEFTGTDRYMVYVHDGYKAKSLKFENCEFYGNTNYIITGSATSHVDACEINNCYFHDNTWNPVYFVASSVENQQTCSDLKVTNSTFANIDCTSEYRSVIDIRPYGSDNTDAIKVVIDHCTFYNNPTINSDHAAIRPYKLTDVTISNCIFAHPEAYERRATYCYGGTVSNCLTFNLTKDASQDGHTWMSTRINCLTADPLFNDLANNKYTYDGNWVTMDLSPARGAATDGSDLGDPRWYSAEVLPEVDFASPYQLVGAKAQIAGNLWYNSGDAYLYYNNKSTNGTATWKIHAEKACVVEVALNLHAESPTVHKLKVNILDADGNSVGEFAEQTSTLPGILSIPAEGDYTIILSDDQAWTSAQIDNITLSYIGGAVQTMPGTTNIADAWFSAQGTRADGKIDFPDGYIQDGWVKWNVSFAEAANYNVTVNIENENGHNYTVALYRSESDESPITIGEGGQKSTIGTLELGALEVPAGNYIMKVTNATQYSDAKLISVNFSYAGGAAVDLSKDTPANLLANADAIISDDWSIEGGKIVHPESKALTGWAKWNVNSADYANYNVTVNISSDNGHLVRVEIFEDENAAPIYTLDETSATQYHTGDQAIDLGNIALDAREYVVKVSNTGAYSHVQITSIVISYQNGARATLPASCTFADLMLSEKAHVTEGNLWFNTIGDSNPVGQWAKWNVKAAAAGTFLFTMNVSSTNGQSYKISILDMNENELDALESGSVGTGDKEVKLYFNLAAGNYIVKLENTYAWSQGHIVSLAVTQPELLTIDETATDNSLIVANYYSEAQDIQINRTIVPGMYNTICLPFDVNSTQLPAIFGSDVELLQMSGATLNGDELTLNFDAATSIYRGTPYLIKTTKTVANPVFTGAIIKAKVGSATSGDDVDFIGSFIKEDIAADASNLYLGANDKLYFSDNAVTIKGMRAYFHIKSGIAPAVKRARIVGPNNLPTGIELVNGELVNGSVKTIENGQLIILRDGKKYNVMGIRL